MNKLVTRFHMLLAAVTLAITGVALLRVPAGFSYVARWDGGVPVWQWPRDLALAIGPILALLFLLVFFTIGRALTRNHFAKTQHILDPALSVLLAVIAAIQLGLLLNGFGSDLDLIRFTGLVLGVGWLPLGVALFEAERHTYAGLRMPWPIASERAWRLVHRSAGIATLLSGAGLLLLAWRDVGFGLTVLGLLAATLGPAMLAALTTALLRD